MPVHHKMGGADLLLLFVSVPFFLALVAALVVPTALWLCTFGVYNKLTQGAFWP